MTGYTEWLVLILAAGWAVTYVWRVVGVYLAERISPDSEALIWVRAVATSLVAALVARIVFAPPGALAVTHLDARLAAIGFGIAGFYLFRRNTGAGVAISIVTLFTLASLQAGGHIGFLF